MTIDFDTEMSLWGLGLAINLKRQWVVMFVLGPFAITIERN